MKTSRRRRTVPGSVQDGETKHEQQASEGKGESEFPWF